jgi:hypothetical protein
LLPRCDDGSTTAGVSIIIIKEEEEKVASKNSVGIKTKKQI